MKEVEVCLNGKDWIPVNSNCVDYIYSDSMPRLIVICDELAELTGKTGLKSAEGKEEDQLKDEIVSIIRSIAQLGRSAGIHVLVATQKPNAEVVPTVLRSNLGWRAFCGRANEAGASLVALDNTLATTVDSSKPGMGIVQSNSINPQFTRFYFSKFEDLDEYYRKRGLDNLGYTPLELENTSTNLEDLDGEEELTSNNDKTVFEFNEERTEIEKRQEQKWENI